MKERAMTARHVPPFSEYLLRLCVFTTKRKEGDRRHHDDNGYRCFYHEELSELFWMRTLIKVGVGMKEVALLCDGAPLECVADAYSSSQKHLEDEIADFIPVN